MGGHQSSVSAALRMSVLELPRKLDISHLGEMDRWKRTHNPLTEIHTETHGLFLPGDVNIWQLRSISCKHVESVCWTEGISVGSQSAMWRCNSLMKNMCARACAHVCVCVREVYHAHVSEHPCFQSVWHSCRACYGLQKQSYLCGGENCKGPIKCAGHRSRHPNICDLCIKQTRKACGERVRNYSPTLLPSSRRRKKKKLWPERNRKTCSK